MSTIVDRSVSTIGDRSVSTIGDRSVSTIGDRSVSTIGDRSVSTIGDRSVFTIRCVFHRENLLGINIVKSYPIAILQTVVSSVNNRTTRAL